MVGFARTHMRCDLDLTRTQHSRLTPHQVSKGSNMKVSGLSSHQAPRRFGPWVIGAAHLASASWLCAEGWRGAAPPPAPRQQPARPWLSCREAQRGARAPSRGARKLDRRGRQADWRAALSFQRFRAKATDLLQSRPFLRHAIVAHRHCSQLAYHAVRLSIAR